MYVHKTVLASVASGTGIQSPVQLETPNWTNFLEVSAGTLGTVLNIVVRRLDDAGANYYPLYEFDLTTEGFGRFVRIPPGSTLQVEVVSNTGWADIAVTSISAPDFA